MNNSSVETEDLRRRFFEALDSGNFELPEDWSIMKETVYTDSPTFEKSNQGSGKIHLRVGIHENGEFSIMSTGMEEDVSGYEYQLGHRWEVDDPRQVAECLINQCIPHAEEEFSP